MDTRRTLRGATGPLEPLTFIDTNVWVYVCDGSEPVKQATATRFLARVARPVISAQVMAEFHSVATRKLRPPMDDRGVRLMLEQIAAVPVVPITADLVLEAQRLRLAHQLSTWDALIVAAALNAGCDRVASEDLAAGANLAGVTVENPFADLADQR